MMFKGFSIVDIHGQPERLLIQILSESLAKTNEALEALSVELKELKKENAALKIDG